MSQPCAGSLGESGGAGSFWAWSADGATSQAKRLASLIHRNHRERITGTNHEHGKAEGRTTGTTATDEEYPHGESRKGDETVGESATGKV